MRASLLPFAASLLACATVPPPVVAPGQSVTTASGLKVECVRDGAGRVARDGDKVRVHYTGTLPDGTVFDSSRPRGEPFSFHLGAGEVIPGWDEGVAGMAVGCVRKLTVPPDLAYGADGHPPQIPPGATLLFEIELVDIE